MHLQVYTSVSTFKLRNKVKKQHLQLIVNKVTPIDDAVTYLLLELERKTRDLKSSQLYPQPNYTSLKHLAK